MPGGAPTKRTAANQARIVEALEKGHTKKSAAARAGMTYQTLNEWAKDDVEFSDALEKAEGIAQGRIVDEIAKAKAWQAQAWLAERRWPKDFGQRQQVEMTGKDGGPIDTRDVSTLSDHEKRALVEAIRDHLATQRSGVRTADGAGGSTSD